VTNPLRDWQHVRFQPILYLFVWAAALRIAVTNDLPIPPDELLTPWAETAWTITSLICPPLALLSWWLIVKSPLTRSALAGLWIRLGADAGQFAALLAYHVVAYRLATGPAAAVMEVAVYFRYITGACMVFCAMVVLRDLRAIVRVERMVRM